MKVKFLSIVATLIVLISVVGALVVFHHSSLRSRQAYAGWWTADLLISYMNVHNGQWPKSWDDLESIIEQGPIVDIAKQLQPDLVFESRRPRASIEELRKLISVKWDANPELLSQEHLHDDGTPPFEVIKGRQGPLLFYSGHEPNELILRYLIAKNASVPSQSTLTNKNSAEIRADTGSNTTK